MDLQSSRIIAVPRAPPHPQPPLLHPSIFHESPPRLNRRFLSSWIWVDAANSHRVFISLCSDWLGPAHSVPAPLLCCERLHFLLLLSCCCCCLLSTFMSHSNDTTAASLKLHELLPPGNSSSSPSSYSSCFWATPPLPPSQTLLTPPNPSPFFIVHFSFSSSPDYYVSVFVKPFTSSFTLRGCLSSSQQEDSGKCGPLTTNTGGERNGICQVALISMFRKTTSSSSITPPPSSSITPHLLPLPLLSVNIM